MEEIGRRLKAARLAKGITLEEVEEETRIRKKYLEALETGRTVLIPGEVYVKGFLRSYGNFLGLDGDALVEEYKARKARPAAEDAPSDGRAAEGSGAEPEAAVAAARPHAEPRQPAFVSLPRRSGRSRSKRRRGGPGPGVYFVRRLMVALILILPVAAAGYWLWGRQAAAPPSPPDPAAQEPGSAVTDPEPEPDPQPDPEPDAKPGPASEPPQPPALQVNMTGPLGPRNQTYLFTVSASPIKVRLEGFTGPPVWMAWTVDGATVYDGKPTEPVEFEGREIEINIGHLQGVDLVINGEPFDPGLEGGPYILQFRTETQD